MKNVEQVLDEVETEHLETVRAVVKAIENDVLTVEHKLAIRNAQVELYDARLFAIDHVKKAEQKLIDTINSVRDEIKSTAKNFDLASLTFHD